MVAASFDYGGKPMEIAQELGSALDTGRSLNTSDSIKVFFVPEGQTWVENGQLHVSAGWNNYEMGQAMLALEQWSNVANIQFVQTTNKASADFTVGTMALTGSTIGYFYLPGTYAEAGTGAFDHTYSGWSDQAGAGLDQGGAGFNLLLHEFGHGMGLGHPHNDSATPGAFPGVTSSSDRGLFDLNQGVTTVMSYIDGWASGPLGRTLSGVYGHAATPMALDIAVIQGIYGINNSFAQGNSTYVLPDANQPGSTFSAIWDTGGIDSILNPSDTKATIDLRGATLQLDVGGGGYMSYVKDVYGGITIAHGVIIENAIGGGGQDILVGNSADNTLTGNAGDDTLFDTLGNDTLRGGDGNDVLEAQFGKNILTGGGGNDHVIGGSQADILRGGTGNDALQGDPSQGVWGGSDTLVAGAGTDFLMGGAGADEFVFLTDNGTNTIATFQASSVNLNQQQVATATGADFVHGLDQITLSGFSSDVENNVMSYVNNQGGSAVFTTQGTTIIFFQVTDITADDFNFV